MEEHVCRQRVAELYKEPLPVQKKVMTPVILQFFKCSGGGGGSSFRGEGSPSKRGDKTREGLFTLNTAKSCRGCFNDLSRWAFPVSSAANGRG